MRDRLSSDIDNPAFVAGVEDALNESERQVSAEEAQRTLAAIHEYCPLPPCVDSTADDPVAGSVRDAA